MVQNKSDPEVQNTKDEALDTQTGSLVDYDVAPFIVSNPKGVLRAIGSLKDDPMLDEWEQALKEWRELQCLAAQNET